MKHKSPQYKLATIPITVPYELVDLAGIKADEMGLDFDVFVARAIEAFIQKPVEMQSHPYCPDENGDCLLGWINCPAKDR